MMMVPEVLKPDNYVDWSIRLKTYLKAQDVWDVIESETQEPSHLEEEDHEIAVKTWRKNNATALYVIQMSCGYSFSLIREFTSAKTAWDTLAEKHSPPPNISLGVSDDCHSFKPFFDALETKNENDMKRVYNNNINLFKAVPPGFEMPVFHILILEAAKPKSPWEELMVKILEEIPEDFLEIRNYRKATALSVVAAMGNIQFAKAIVGKKSDFLRFTDGHNHIPVVVAVSFGCVQMARYLYKATLMKEGSVLCVDHDHGKHGATLINKCIKMRNLDIAIDLLEHHPHLTFAKDIDGKSPLYTMACAPLLFRSGHRLRFWQHCIYNRVHIQPVDFNEEDSSKQDDCQVKVDISNQDDCHVGKEKKQRKHSGPELLPCRLVTIVRKLLGIERIHEIKLVHKRSSKLLYQIFEVIKKANCNQIKDGLVNDALFKAADLGNLNVVISLIVARFPLLHAQDAEGRDFFMHATLSRQEKIFSFCYSMCDSRGIKLMTGSMKDKFENNLLHIAGMLAPPGVLNRIPGAALRMQRELQWFKVVETIVPPSASTSENSAGMTPRDFFNKNHKNLVAQGEKWMKQTATSCSVVGALIITIMFSSVIQVPGGNQDTGNPIFLHEKLFRVFIFSDYLSLVFSTTSVLIFLGILTSRYEEEDFLVSLPKKLILGLSTLFISIASMIVAFSSVLLIMLSKDSWIIIPVILLAIVPVTIFVWMQFPLLVEIFMSTYGPSIFKKKFNLDSWQKELQEAKN